MLRQCLLVTGILAASWAAVCECSRISRTPLGLHLPGNHRRDLRESRSWRAAIENTLQSTAPSAWELAWEEMGGSNTTTDASNLRPGRQGEAQQASSSSNKELQQLISCVNAKFDSKNMTWHLALAGALGSIKAVGAFASSAPALEPEKEPFPVTVVTSASVSRLPQLYSQCLSWAGPLSAVLYQPILQQPGPLTEANQAVLRLAAYQVSQFMADMKVAEGACKPDVLLVYEVFQDEAARKFLYPFNILRNVARLQARTPLIAMVDVDLVLSRSFYARFEDADVVKDMVDKARKRQVFIIPAFDVRGRHEKAAWAEALVSAKKDMLVHAFKRDIVFQFALDAYKVGHALTNYTHWLSASQDYPTQFEALCEPWFVGSRQALPWHDARYRGYGLDKVQFVSDVNATGFSFVVMHDAFAIHRAHKKNEARAVFLGNKTSKTAEPTLFQHNVKLYMDQCTAYKLGKEFKPVLHPSTAHCKSILPWWKSGKQ